MSYPFGVIPPNGDLDGIEFMAFNLYAMNIEELNLIVDEIIEMIEEDPYETEFNFDIDTEEIIGREITELEQKYVRYEVYNRLRGSLG